MLVDEQRARGYYQDFLISVAPHQLATGQQKRGSLISLPSRLRNRSTMPQDAPPGGWPVSHAFGLLAGLARHARGLPLW
jgi:hypothetical protein